MLTNIIPKLKDDEIALVVGHSKTGRYLLNPDSNGRRARFKNCVIRPVGIEHLFETINDD